MRGIVKGAGRIAVMAALATIVGGLRRAGWAIPQVDRLEHGPPDRPCSEGLRHDPNSE